MTRRLRLKTMNRENSIQEIFGLVVEPFLYQQAQNKDAFFLKVFDAAFKLIPEAEKGSFYELKEDMYSPVFAHGYDFDTLKKLKFNRQDAFIDFSCSDIAAIDAYEVHIQKRDESKFSKETIETFKQLGTYENFTSMYAPIQADGVNFGLLCLENFGKQSFSKRSKAVLRFYAQLISNFYNQRIQQERETKLYQETVNALVSAIELKDKYTEGHAKRVAEYSCLLAKEYGLDSSRIKNIEIAALLHDVGKIGIPSRILNKPGTLTREEYEHIKEHPLFTKKILDNIDGLPLVSDFAYLHHEHYDGTGYPLGLRGDEIPIEAQIIQLADAYDAMTSKRAYRDAATARTALEIIRKEAGKQFHPELSLLALTAFQIHNKKD